MNLKPYFKLLTITLIFTFFSYLCEFSNNTSINNLKNANNAGLFAFRYLHYLYLFYFSIFLLLFSYKGIDAVIFLIASILMMFSWVCLQCCIISYYELKFYKVNYRDYLTNFHPCLYAIFKDYQWLPLMLSGVLMFITFFYILIKNRIIPYIYKLIAGVVFLYLFIDNIIKTRYYDTNLKYPKNRDHILYKYLTFI